MSLIPLNRARIGLVTAAGLLTLAACGGGEPERQITSTTSGTFPVTVENCDASVTLERAPQRVVLLKGSAVPFLQDLGVMDRVTARAGQYPDAYYDPATRAELDEIELLTDELDSSGHLQISKEVVLAKEPDLVLGEVDNLSRSTLSAVDIPLIEEPGLCEQGLPDPGFDDIYDQYRTYGKVFGREAQAEQAIADLETRVQELRDRVGGPSGRTAAVLYPTIGGGTTYAYGTESMAHPQLRAAGFENVFDDVDERVFEVTLEELLGRDPDVLILLHSEGSAADIEAEISSLPGAEELTAVRNGDVMAQLFNFTEPPTPLSVDGLERIIDRFGGSDDRG